VDSAADAATTGGLNQASTTGSKTDALANIAKSAVTKAVTGAVKGQIRSGINKAIGVKTAKQPSVGKQLVKGVASQIGSKVVPKSMAISKLIPVSTAKKTAPTKVNVSKLTPVSNISGLSTLVNRKG